MSKALKTAKEIVNLVIKNSEIIQPYIKPKHYVQGLMVLNGLYLLLKMADKDQSNPNPINPANLNKE